MGCTWSKNKSYVRVSVQLCPDAMMDDVFKEDMKFTISLDKFNEKNIEDKLIWLLSLEELQPDKYLVKQTSTLEYVPMTNKSILRGLSIQKGILCVKVRVLCQVLDLRNKSIWTQFTFPFGNL